MLDAYIIEDLKREDEIRRSSMDRPRIHIDRRPPEGPSEGLEDGEADEPVTEDVIIRISL